MRTDTWYDEQRAALMRTKLVLIRADMAALHHGLVEMDKLPDLQTKLATWVGVVGDAMKFFPPDSEPNEGAG